METPEENYTVGKYYLTLNRQGKWCRSWYDEQAQQRKSASLRTTDFQEAKRALDEWFIKTKSPVLDADLELSRCFIEYWDQHGQHLDRHKSESNNMVFWLEYFPEKLIKELRPPDQRKFIKHLVDLDYSKSYIEGIFKTGSAAINFAWKNDMMLSPLPLLSPSKELKKFKFKKKKKWRPLNIDELALFIDHAQTDHLIRYVMIMIACACRPSAAIELEGRQVDLCVGTVDLLKYGKEQNNKYRATVKLPSFIRKICHDNNLVFKDRVDLGDNRQIEKIRKTWNGARSLSKLDALVVPSSIRHTMARWLRASGVQPWDTLSQMGHKRSGSEITEIYAPNDPEYLSSALTAIERYFELLTEKSWRLKLFMEKDSQNSMPAKAELIGRCKDCCFSYVSGSGTKLHCIKYSNLAVSVSRFCNAPAGGYNQADIEFCTKKKLTWL